MLNLDFSEADRWASLSMAELVQDLVKLFPVPPFAQLAIGTVGATAMVAIIIYQVWRKTSRELDKADTLTDLELDLARAKTEAEIRRLNREGDPK